MYITEQLDVFLLKDLSYPLKEQVTALFYSKNLTPVIRFMYYYASITDKVIQFYETTRNHQYMHSRFQAFTVFCMLYAFFWVITRHLKFICQRFGTLYFFFNSIYFLFDRSKGVVNPQDIEHVNI